MTNEEAIQILKTEGCYECAYGCDSPISCEAEDCELKKAMKIAVEALEKQIAKNPLHSGLEYDCPKCLGQVGYIRSDMQLVRDGYCDCCGQKLNWSGQYDE